MLPEPVGFLGCPLGQLVQIGLAGPGQGGYIHQQGAGLQHQPDVGVLLPVANPVQLVGGEHLPQVFSGESQMPGTADQIQQAAGPTGSLRDDGQVPGNVPETVVR